MLCSVRDRFVDDAQSRSGVMAMVRAWCVMRTLISWFQAIRCCSCPQELWNRSATQRKRRRTTSGTFAKACIIVSILFPNDLQCMRSKSAI